MKINSQLTALFLGNVVLGASAFTSVAPKANSAVVLQASERFDPGPPPLGTQMPMPGPRAPPGNAGPLSRPPNLVPDMDSSELVAMDMFPVYPSLETVQGGGTVRTYKMPIWANKCQMLFTTDGRPLKAEANLWLGPLRVVHTLQVDMEDGAKTPYQATLTFKKMGQVLKISTSDTLEFPMLAGVYVPNPDRADELTMNTEDVWESASPEQKKRIQGGSTMGGGGAIRYWQIPPNVQSVQLLGWSKDVGKKSFKLKVEVLQGPNNIKQGFFVQCGGGSQPYHSVIQTPGSGSVIRITNQKFLEDGLVEIALVPYEVAGEVPIDMPSIADAGTKFPSSGSSWWWDGSNTITAPRSSLPAAVVKCARFSEPADDSDSLIDRPLPTTTTTTTTTTATSPQPSDSFRNTTSSSLPEVAKPPSSHTNTTTTTTTTKTNAFVVPPHVTEESDSGIDHSPTSLPQFRDPRTCMWTSSHAANAPSEDRSASLVNVLLQPLPPNFDSETQLPPLEKEYSSLIRLNLWSVIDGHGGGCVATYASEVLLPHVAATISRALGCAIVSRGVCLVNGQLRDANALDLDGLIMTSDRSPANPNSIHYRSPCEASDDDDEGADTEVPDDEATQDSQEHRSQASTTGESIASSLLPSSPRAPTAVSSVAASVSSVKTSVKTAASPAACDAPIGTHSPSEVAAITRAITESFLAVDEGWINSIDPVATHQTSCQSNGRWNSGACALTVFSIQRLEWTNVSEEHQERELRSPAKKLGHDTSQNEDAARRRMLDYATRAKSASSLSTISSTSSLTTTDDRVNTSGLESEITETEGEDDDHSKDDEKTRRRNPLRRADRETAQKESLISAPGGCSCHCYRAYDALLYTAHVGDCRAVMLGPAPPRTIKVHGSATGHPEATDDESRHHSSDETECLSSSDHDADSSDDDDIDLQETPATATTSSYMSCMLRPARRQSRRLAKDDFGTNAPFIALPPLEGFQSVEVEIDSDGDLPGRACHSGMLHSDSSSSSSSSQDSHDDNPIIQLTPVTRPIDLTTDHSAYNPAEVTAVLRRCNNAPRAIAAGVGGGIKRVAGSLAVTRALGDAYLKTPSLSFFPYKRHAPYITARPEVNCRPIVKDGDKVLILATDGVWERSSGEDVLRWVRNFYAERIARAERRQNRRQNQSERCSNDGSVRCKRDENSDERNNGLEMVGCKSDMPRSPSPPTKRRKLRSNRWGLAPFGSQRNSNVSDVIVRRILNKVRRTRNISSLHALMSLPPGRARRSKHDDITSCVVDLSAFVL